MSLASLPEEMHESGNPPRFSSFVVDEVISDTFNSTFDTGDLDLSRGSEILIRGHIYWRRCNVWCQTMPKIPVTIPTLYKPIQVQLKILCLKDEDSSDKWVGFYVAIHDICTLNVWKNRVYFSLSIYTPFRKKNARYVEYTPTDNCWGWSRFFKVSTVQACQGNPFIIDIGLTHYLTPNFMRLPFISFCPSPDDATNFNDESQNQMRNARKCKESESSTRIFFNSKTKSGFVSSTSSQEETRRNVMSRSRNQRNVVEGLTRSLDSFQRPRRPRTQPAVRSYNRLMIQPSPKIGKSPE